MFKVHEVINEDIKKIAKSLEKEAQVLNGRTVIVGGGAGFLGTYIVGTLIVLNKNFLSNPCKIYVLDNFITGKYNFTLSSKDPNVKFIKHDIRRPLTKSLKGDFLIHAAGLASPVYYQKFPLETIDVTVNGTRNFLDFAKKNDSQSVLFFSSSEIYGDPDPNFIPTPETYWGNVSSIGPRACYDESKRMAETICTIYRRLYELPVKIVRPFNVFGPLMKTNDYRVVPNFMVKALKGDPITVYDKGNQTRTFCYISDAVSGFLKVLFSKRDGEIYNVGNDQDEISISSLANIIKEISPKPVKIEVINYPDSYPAGEPYRRCPDLSKIRSHLGYNPVVNLRAGLERTMRWYQSLPEFKKSKLVSKK